MEFTGEYTMVGYSTTAIKLLSTNESSISNPREFCGQKTILLIVKIILCIFAVAGNSLVILSVWKFRQMRTIDNILIVNLAVSSVFVCTHILTDIMNWTFDIVDTSLKYICLAKTADTILVLISSVFNLLLMTIERYIAVIHPLRFKAIVTHRRVKVILAVCWTFYMVFSFIPFAGLNSFDLPDSNRFMVGDSKHCDLHKVLVRWYGLTLVLILLIATTFNLGLFLRVLCVIYVSNRKRKRDNRTHVPSNRKTFTVLLTLFSFILGWIPFVFTFAIKKKDMNIVDLCVMASPYNIGVLYSSINWLVYGVMRPKFRQCFKAIVTCKPLQTHSFNSSREFSSSSSAMLRRT